MKVNESEDDTAQFWIPMSMREELDATIESLNVRHPEMNRMTRSSFTRRCILYVIDQLAVSGCNCRTCRKTSDSAKAGSPTFVPA